jgi:hypothetical protein
MADRLSLVRPTAYTTKDPTLPLASAYSAPSGPGGMLVPASLFTLTPVMPPAEMLYVLCAVVPFPPKYVAVT